MFYLYSLPVPRLTAGNPFFDALVPRAARLTCTRAEFAALWQEVMGSAWDESKEFAHILSTFPLVFPDTPEGQAKREALLATYERVKP